MHKSMRNRAADANILTQLSKMKSGIHLLKIAGEFVNIPEASTSEQSSQPRQRHELEESNSLDMALDCTIHSIEDFVDDSVSTVYARSTSGSEASQSRSSITLHKTSSRFREAPVDQFGMIKLLDNWTIDDLNARIINEAFDCDDLHASLETLDDLELQRLAFYASSNG